MSCFQTLCEELHHIKHLLENPSKSAIGLFLEQYSSYQDQGLSQNSLDRVSEEAAEVTLIGHVDDSLAIENTNNSNSNTSSPENPRNPSGNLIADAGWSRAPSPHPGASAMPVFTAGKHNQVVTHL